MLNTIDLILDAALDGHGLAYRLCNKPTKAWWYLHSACSCPDAHCQILHSYGAAALPILVCSFEIFFHLAVLSKAVAQADRSAIYPLSRFLGGSIEPRCGHRADTEAALFSVARFVIFRPHCHEIAIESAVAHFNFEKIRDFTAYAAEA